MSKRFRYRPRVEPKNRLNVRDIEFNFSDVQTKNPKLQGKTPLVLFTKDPLTAIRKRPKRWFDDIYRS